MQPEKWSLQDDTNGKVLSQDHGQLAWLWVWFFFSSYSAFQQKVKLMLLKMTWELNSGKNGLSRIFLKYAFILYACGTIKKSKNWDCDFWHQEPVSLWESNAHDLRWSCLTWIPSTTTSVCEVGFSWQLISQPCFHI